MFAEIQILIEESSLIHLLAHYAQAGVADLEAWQDRLMQMGDAAPEQLTRMHGKLLACEWIEQNTGATPRLQPGAVPQCYRVTLWGRRALKRALLQRPHEEDDAET